MNFDKMTEYAKCKMIRSFIMTNVGDALVKGNKINLDEMVGFMMKDVGVIDVSQLTIVEMIQLGFTQFAVECGYYLIPSWLYPYLKNGVKYYSVENDEIVTDTNYMKACAMFGLLQYGAFPIDGSGSVSETFQLENITEKGVVED